MTVELIRLDQWIRCSNSGKSKVFFQPSGKVMEPRPCTLRHQDRFDTGATRVFNLVNVLNSAKLCVTDASFPDHFQPDERRRIGADAQGTAIANSGRIPRFAAASDEHGDRSVRKIGAG